MKAYEQQIKMFARRIKKIEESPDPTLLRSNKLLYELEKERVEQQLDSCQRGKPFAEGTGCLTGLFRAMGFQQGYFFQTADRSKGYPEYKQVIQKMGFPEKCCDRTVASLAMCEIGDLPKPDIVVVSSHSCDAGVLSRYALARWNNIPVFSLDATLNADDKLTLASLNYIAEQLGELIEWAEKKVPGVKYHDDKLREIQEIDDIGEDYLREIYQLRKHVPCPIAPLDAFRILREPSRYPNMQKANEYLRIVRDELGERVASGKGPYPEERLRLLWAASGTYNQVFNPWRLLMERKVAMPLLRRGNDLSTLALREVSEYGVKLSPLQIESSELATSSWGGPGKRWVNDGLDCARDLGVQGIVHFLQIGCTPILGLASVIAERAEKELGIPVMNVEGRQLDQGYMNQEQFERKLTFFIDKCFDWAGKPRQ